MKNYKLDIVDAQQMKKAHPDTFEAPTQEELDSVKVDSVVKVCVSSERFWTIVTKVEGEKVTAIINNDLVLTPEHGLQCDDVIEFEKKNIYNIYEE